MQSVRASIVTLLVGAGFLFLGFGLMATLLPIRAQVEGFSTTMIGVMGGVYYGGFAFGCLVGPQVIMRVGHIRAFAGFAALCAALLLSHPLAIGEVSWIALRAVTGICMAVLYMVIESWLNVVSSNEIRGRVLSLYVIVSNVVTMLGQLSLNLYDPAGPVLFSLCAIVLCLSLVPLSLVPTATPKPIAKAKLEIGRLFKYSPAGFVGCLLFGLVDGAFWSLTPVFVQDQGFSIATVSLVMALFLVGGTLSQWPLGRWSDSIDRRWVLVLACAGTTGTGLAIGLLPLENTLVVYALACAHGAFMIPIYPLLLAHVNDHAPTEALVETSGGLLLLYAAGAVAGPFIAAPLMDAYSGGALFVFIAGILGPLALYILYRLTRRRLQPSDERVTFYPVPHTTQSVYDLETDD